MIARRPIRLVAAITALIGFVLSVLTDNDGSATVALKVYSYGTSASVAGFLLYEHLLWHLPIVRRVTKQPDLRGTWKGELISSYQKDGKPIPPIPSILRITQTASSQHITLFSGESYSVTEQSQLVKEADGRWRLTWTYTNTPRASVRHRSDCHLGTAEVIFDQQDGLAGSYYTDRLTRGELNYPRRSRRLYSSVSSAEANTTSFMGL